MVNKNYLLKEDFHQETRTKMIDCQLKPRGISDCAIWDAFMQVPREIFVPEISNPYGDCYIALGSNRGLMSPTMLARLLVAACIEPAHTVLSVGSGTGYAGTVVSYLASMVFCLESDADLEREGEENVMLLGIDNLAFFNKPLGEGLPDVAPFDRIIIEGSVEVLPASLFEQLAEGGRLLTFLNREHGVQEAVCFHKGHEHLEEKTLFEAQLPVLKEFSKEQSFQL